MAVLAGVGAVLLIVIILLDGFETVVLPRRVTGRARLSRIFHLATWAPWSALARWQPKGARRETWLSFYGPLSLILLIGVWAAGLVVGFALLQWALGSSLAAPEARATLLTDLYMSGTTFFTLGLGDVTPRSSLARALTVVEAGTGFGFLALVITYLPVLYQAFSRREVAISMLDERAGTPSTAVEMLRRLSDRGPISGLGQFLEEWERWSAELMETHLSYLVLAHYRSQHEDQSWLAALTMILDVCTLVLVGLEDVPKSQAQLTFAMTRHCVVDLTQVLGTRPCRPEPDRFPPGGLSDLRSVLSEAGISLREGRGADQKMAELRSAYEPYVCALADHLLMPLPDWVPAPEAQDNWQTTAWE